MVDYNDTNDVMLHTRYMELIDIYHNKPVHLVQHDNLHVVKIDILINGQPYVLPNEFQASIRWSSETASKNKIIKDTLGCNKERTAIYFSIDEFMTSEAGVYKPVIELTTNNKTYISGNNSLIFKVNEDPISSLIKN